MSVIIDLIFGVPGETAASWRADLDTTALEPDRISTYGLTFERGTTFWNRLAHGQACPWTKSWIVKRFVVPSTGSPPPASSTTRFQTSPAPAVAASTAEAYWAGEQYFAAGPGDALIAGVRESIIGARRPTWARVSRPAARRLRVSAGEDRARELLVFGLRRMEGVALPGSPAAPATHSTRLGGKSLERFLATGLLEDTWRANPPHARLTSSLAMPSGQFLALLSKRKLQR